MRFIQKFIFNARVTMHKIILQKMHKKIFCNFFMHCKKKFQTEKSWFQVLI